MKRILWKKTVALLLAFAMLIPAVPFTFAASPSDFVDFPTGWSNEAVTAAVNNGLLNGRSANTIEPQGTLTRAEMATIINRAFGATIEANISAFTDVPSTEWYYHEIAKAVNMQTFQGDGTGTMRPSAPITRQEVFAVIARALVLETSDYSPLARFNDAYAVSEWAKPYAAILVAKGYVNGDTMGNLNPLSNITREEFAQIMHNIIKTYYIYSGEHKTTGASSSLIRTSGVTLSDVTIEGDLILGDGVGKGTVNLVNVTIKGRLLARGGEGAVTLTNTTVAGGVVVKDVNGIVNFNNYRTDAPFAGIREITKATFIGESTGGGVTPGVGGGGIGGGGSGGGGGNLPPAVLPTQITYYVSHYIEAWDGTIDFNGTKYKLESKQTLTDTDGMNVAVPAAKTITGYTFSSSLGDGSKAGTTQTTVTSGKEFKFYYNANSYTVTIDKPDGGTETLTYKHGDTLGGASNLGDHFNFDYYPTDKFYNKDGNSIVNASTLVTSDMNIGFKEKITVTLDYNYDGISDTATAYKDERFGDSLPQPSPRTGYEFKGWKTVSGASFDKNTLVTAPITIIAQWEASAYNITYVSQFDFASIVPSKYVYDTDLTLPVAGDFVTHTGYTFGGWFKTNQSTDANRLYTISAKSMTGDITLYAKWIPNSSIGDKCKVTIHLNHPDKADTFELLWDKNTALSSGQLTTGYSSYVTGYEIVGWYKDAACTQPYGFGSVTGELDLYAEWEPILYTITYVLNQAGASFVGVSDTDTYTIEADKTVYSDGQVSHPGKHLVGWHLDAPNGPIVTTISAGSTGNKTLYGKWADNTYTVTVKMLNPDGITFTDKHYPAVHGQQIKDVITETFTKTGYAYDKFTAYQGSTEYGFDHAITSDITIEPVWTPIQYNVTYNINGGVLRDEAAFNSTYKKYTIESGLTLPLAGVFEDRPGYTFMGWHSDENFTGTPATEISQGVTGDKEFYAYWKPDTYTVKFVDDDGVTEIVAAATVDFDAKITKPANPEKNGYTFDSWVNSAGYNFDEVIDVVPQSNLITFVAKWTAIKYTVTYVGKDTDYTISGQVPTEFYITSDDITLPTVVTPSDTGKEFYGWYLDENCTESITKIAKGTAKSLTLYAGLRDKAKVYYNVIFDYNYDNKGEFSKQSVEANSAANRPASDPERVGYDFTGWYADSAANAVFNFSTPINAPTTIYAGWEQSEYEITFMSDGTSAVKTYYYDEAIEDKMSSPSKRGYTFGGWNTQSDGKGMTYAADYVIKGEMPDTLYAIFTPIEYTVNYNYDQNVLGITTKNPTEFIENYKKFIITDLDLALPTEADFANIPEGYELKGWYLDEELANSAGEYITDIPTVGTELKYYAKWGKKVFVVNYVDANGTHNTDDFEYGDQLPSQTKFGHTFDGWAVSSDGQVEYAPSRPVTSDICNNKTITLWPKFTAIDYTITYVLGNGHYFKDGYAAQNTYTVNDDIIVPSDGAFIPNDRYRLGGWKLDVSDVAYQTLAGGASIPAGAFAQHITATAVWVDRVKVDFAYNYSSAPDNGVFDSVYVDKGAQASAPVQNPSRTGYTFGGWDFDFAKKVESDTSIKALWSPISYTVKYLPGDGTDPNKTTVHKYDVEANLDSLIALGFTKKGHTFSHWEAQDKETYSDGALVENLTSSDGATIELTAVWSPNEYTIAFDKNASDAAGNMASVNPAFTASGTLPENGYTRTGYTFLGWSLDSNATEATYQNKEELSKVLDGIADKTEPVTLYAVWSENTYNIKFMSADGTKVLKSRDNAKYTDVIHFDEYIVSSDGHTLIGWSKSPNAATVDYRVDYIASGLAESGEVKLYAVWSINRYTLKLDYNNGEAVKTQALKYTDVYVLPTPSRTGYTFKGWSESDEIVWWKDEDVNNSLIAYSDGQSVSALTSKDGDTYSLYAVWQANTYTVTFVAEDGAITLPQNADKLGYTQDNGTTKLTIAYDGYYPTLPTAKYTGQGKMYFVGWKYSDKLIVAGDSYKIVGNITLTAEWKETLTHTITFVNGYIDRVNANSSITIDDGEKVAKPSPDPQRDGYTFLGWYQNQNNGAPKYDFDMAVKSTDDKSLSIQIFGQWKKHTYTVAFDANGGEGTDMDDMSFTYDVAQNLSECTYTRTGYTFLGWSEDKNATAATYTDTQSVSKLTAQDKGEITLYAVWSENTYTINYNNNTGSGTMQAQSFKYTAVPEKLTDNAFSKTGYTFDGWALSSKGDVAYKDESLAQAVLGYMLDNSTTSVTLYAVWSPITYNVVYNGKHDGDTFDVTGTMQGSTFTYGAAVTFRANEFERSGYKFKGWKFGNATYAQDTQYNINLATTQDAVVNVYAVWEPVSYTVKYNIGFVETADDKAEGTTETSKHTFDTTQKLTQNGFTRTGYTFVGWTRIAPTDVTALNSLSLMLLAEEDTGAEFDNGEAVTNLTDEEDGVVQLYAVWRTNKYTVVYDANGADGGTAPAQVNAEYTKEFTIASKGDMYKTGYTFTGWNTHREGKLTSYESGKKYMNLTEDDGATVTLYAQWKENSYTVQYDINGGKGTAPASHSDVAYSKTITIAGDSSFARTGYTFLGWSESKTATVADYKAKDMVSALSDINGDVITLYAVWQANSYKVTFDVNGGIDLTSADIPSDGSYSFENNNLILTVTYDSFYPTLPAAKHETMYFGGWEIVGTGKVSKGDLVAITEAVTLSAVWTPKPVHNVSFLDYNDKGAYQVSVINESKITADEIEDLKNPEKIGYTFGGWYDEASLTTKFDFDRTFIYSESQQITVYPNWIPNKYTVSFDANGGTGAAMADQTHTYGESLNLSANTYKKAGHSFNGWTDEAGNKYTDGQTVKNLTAKNNDEIKLTAQWLVKEYIICFDGNGQTDGTMDNMSFEYTDGISLISNAYKKKGYTFLGWSHEQNAEKETYSDGAEQSKLDDALLASESGVVTLYAVWSENSYNIAFNANTGDGEMDTITLKFTEHKNLPANKLTKQGHQFTGWNTRADGSGASYADKKEVYELISTPGGTITLYAQWGADIRTVSFDMNGATTAPITAQSIAYGSSATCPQAVPEKYGYDFKGWYLDGEEYDFSKPVTESITLKAEWTPKAVQVNFVDPSDNNKKLGEQTTSHGDKLPTINDPTKRYYTFAGWYQDARCTIPVGDDYLVQYADGNDVYIYAKWDEEQYTITYIRSGGTVLDANAFPETYTYFEPVTLPNSDAIEKPGYTLMGWKIIDPPHLEIRYEGWSFKKLDAGMFSEDITLAAVWTEDSLPVGPGVEVGGGSGIAGGGIVTTTRIVNFYLGDGSKEPYASYSYGEGETLSARMNRVVIKPGYTFNHWVDVATGDVYDDDTIITKSVELVAVFTANKYTVIYDGNGADGTMVASEHTYDEEKALSANAYTKKNYRFIGWSLTKDGKVAYSDGQTVVNLTETNGERIRLYAQWEYAEYYKITLMKDANTQHLSFELKADSAIADYSLYTKPEKELHTFEGWTVSSDGQGEVYDIDAPITKDVTLYAIWKAKTYTITYNNVDDEDMADSAAFPKEWKATEEFTLPVSTHFNERTSAAGTVEVFAGWYLDKECTSDAAPSIPVGNTENVELYAKWDVGYTVTFYYGAVENSSYKLNATTVAADKTVSSDAFDEAHKVWDTYYDATEGYTDIDGSKHEIYPEFWYVTDSGEWAIFDETVKVNTNMSVFYTFKYLSMYFDIELGEFKLARPVQFSVPYETDTRLMDSLKDALTFARGDISMALDMDDIYTKAIAKASEKSRDLIDADGNIKYVEIDTAISKIIKSDEIGGEIAEYIENLIVNIETADEAKLDSAIELVADSKAVEDICGGAYSYDKVKDYITGLDVAGREAFAEDIYDAFTAKQYYKDFIAAFEAEHDSFAITQDNVDLVMAVATAVGEYTYEELKDRIYASFGKVIDVLGDDIVKEFMQDAQKRYYNDVHEIWEQAHSSGSDYTSTYPSYLTFKVNAIDDVLRPLYDKYRTKAIDKFTEDNIYYYAENKYLQQLVDIDADTLIRDLFYEVPETDENIGYALWKSENGESGFMHYYDYMLEKLILLDKALLWYQETLSADELEAFKVKAFADASKALNKANEMLDAYEEDGSLPLGKNIDDLMEIEAFAKIFGKVEDKLIKALEKYKSTQFYGKTWDSDSLRYDVEFADEAADIILGVDEPTFNIDSLLDKDIVKKALDKAGFADYDYPASGDSVTEDAKERVFRDSQIIMRRFYQSQRQ